MLQPSGKGRESACEVVMAARWVLVVTRDGPLFSARKLAEPRGTVDRIRRLWHNCSDSLQGERRATGCCSAPQLRLAAAVLGTGRVAQRWVRCSGSGVVAALSRHNGGQVVGDTDR